MATHIRLRRGTSDEWSSLNTVLLEAEMGLDLDTGIIKIGDGETPWNALSGWNPSGTLASTQSSRLSVIGDSGVGTTQSVNAVSTVGTAETRIRIGADATNIAPVWIHWYTQTATNPKTDAYPSGSITFKASLQVISSSDPSTTTGQIYPITFGGQSSVTLAPGASTKADELGISVKKGDIVAIRTFLSSGTAYGPRLTYGAWVANNGGFTTTTDLTPSGSAAVTGANGAFYGPALLLGHTEPSASSVYLVGDSIAFGIGDNGLVFSQPAVAGAGFAIRALSGNAGLINAAMGGDLATYFQTTNGSVRRMSLGGFATRAIIEDGSNDLSTGVTAAQIESANLDIAVKLRRLGISKVFLTTLIPRTNSTDGWATTTNQTPLSMETDRVSYNTWVRAGCPVDQSTRQPVPVGTPLALLAGSISHPVTGFFDTASKVESSLNSGFWKPADRVVTGSIASGGQVITSAGASFQSAVLENGGDLGSSVVLRGAGTSGADYYSHIATVTNSTTVTTNGVAGTTVTNAQLNVGVRTGDGVHPSSYGANEMASAIDTSQL